MAIVDFHNHVMPGVDDGAQTAEECADALRAFQGDGVATVVATPHIEASLLRSDHEFRARMAEFDAGWALLEQVARKVNVRVERAAEVALDVPEPDLSDARLRLAGSKYFLMEFPFMMVPPHSAEAVRAIANAGYTPIIAHPERYNAYTSSLADEWKQSGALLQVNGPSLLGRFGPASRRAAFELLERGLVDYICSDYHARGAPLVAQYRALLERADAAEQAHTLMDINPSRMLDGLAPLPVAQLRTKRTVWGRVAAIFRS